MRPVLGAILLTACDVVPAPIESAHFSVHPAVDAPICGGTLGAMDRYLEDLRAELGLPPPARIIDFYWLDLVDVARHCPRGAAGCVDLSTGTIYGDELPYPHEIVHAALPLDTNTASWLAEGVAVALAGGDADLRFDRPDALALVRDGRARLDAGSYPVAGAWVRHLLDRFGVDRVMRLYTAIHPEQSESDVAAVFESITGAPLADVAAAFADRFDGCPYTGATLNLWECAAPPLAWDGDRLDHQRTLDCADPDVVGPFQATTARTFATLDVDVPGLFELSFAGAFAPSDALRLEFAACAATCEHPLHTRLDPGDSDVLALAPGRHYLALTGPADAAASVGVTLRRLALE